MQDYQHIITHHFAPKMYNLAWNRHVIQKLFHIHLRLHPTKSYTQWCMKYVCALNSLKINSFYCFDHDVDWLRFIFMLHCTKKQHQHQSFVSAFQHYILNCDLTWSSVFLITVFQHHLIKFDAEMTLSRSNYFHTKSLTWNKSS